MDYLFVGDRGVRQDLAILIIVCLIDLQEDFRHYVKRSFLNYLLSCVIFGLILPHSYGH